MKKRLPFSIDRERDLPLISQIVEGVTQAVQAGLYKPGDILPGFREIAEELGASLIVVRAAFARLADDGFVCRRRGVGTIVLDPFDAGRVFADCVLRHLESEGRVPAFSSIKPMYIPGETFPAEKRNGE